MLARQSSDEADNVMLCRVRVLDAYFILVGVYNMEVFMYAHDLIEALKTWPQWKQTVDKINLIKESQHFFIKNQGDFFDTFNDNSNVGKPLFYKELCFGIMPPYNKMCIHFTHNKEEILESDMKKGVISFEYNPSLDEMRINLYSLRVSTNNWEDGLGTYILLGFADPDIKPEISMIENITCDGTYNEKKSAHLLLVAYFYLMLLNTKNITTIDNPPPAKLNKKRIKNGKQPLFTYKTLRLQLPAKKRKKGSGLSTATDNTTRLHLCRGHFKTYTEEKPLLGRFTGRYWWQPHARGDKSQGVVMKDYEVKI